MTKKGFDYEECYLKFDGEIFAIAENKKNAKVIGETLIQLFDENEQLKTELKKSKKAHSRCDKLWWKLYDEKKQLEKENEQLNQEIWDSGTACAEEVIKIEDEFDKEISRLIRENNELKSKFSVQLDSLKDENKNLKKENKDLEELLHLITGIFSFEKEESVKELLRNEIRGLDAVSYEFAGAWNDYCILSKFFQERYGEHWDNE